MRQAIDQLKGVAVRRGWNRDLAATKSKEEKEIKSIHQQRKMIQTPRL